MNALASKLAMSLRQGIARDTVLVAVSQLANRGSLILGGIIVSHFLGQSAFASYSFLLLTASLIATMTGMGLGLLASRAAATGLVQGIGPYAQRMPALMLLTCVSSTLAAVVPLVLPGEWLHVNRLIERIMLAALAWTGVISGVLVGLMNGMSRFDAVARAAMVGAAIVIGGAAVASLLNMADVALFALVLGQLALIVLIAPVVRKSTVSSELGSWRQVKCLSAFQDLFGTIIPVFLTSLIWMFAMWWGGKRVLAEEGGDIQFAYYAIGLHWFSAILFLPGALNNALLPRLFGASAATYREGREPLRAMAFKGAATAALIAIMAALCVLALNAMGMLASGYAVESHMLTPVIVVFMQAAVLASAAAILGNAVIAARGAHVWLIGITLYAVIFHVMPTLLKWEISAVGISRALSVAYLVLAIYGVTAMMACTHKSGCIKGA